MMSSYLSLLRILFVIVLIYDVILRFQQLVFVLNDRLLHVLDQCVIEVLEYDCLILHFELSYVQLRFVLSIELYVVFLLVHVVVRFELDRDLVFDDVE